MAAGAQMWESEMFTEDPMVAWENRPATNQTWTNLQTYFMEKWLERRQYLAATAKQSCFKEAALAVQEQAAATEEGEMQAMMFALLKRAASIAAQVDGHGKQGHNGGNDGANKRSSRSPRWKKVPSRQREHSSPNKRRQEK